LENDDGASSSDAGLSSNFSNGHCRRHHGSSSDMADEDDEDGDGIFPFRNMDIDFEISKKENNEF
jgi:hypothetical protein